MYHAKYTTNGTDYTAILSPQAVRIMEQECEHGYAQILSEATRDFTSAMCAFCAACLQHERGPAFTGDALFQELGLDDIARFKDGMLTLRHLYRQIVTIDGPDAPLPGDDAPGDPGNAEAPPTAGGPGSATTATGT